jgi:ubiquitin C-terminal hydrolase
METVKKTSNDKSGPKNEKIVEKRSTERKLNNVEKKSSRYKHERNKKLAPGPRQLVFRGSFRPQTYAVSLHVFTIFSGSWTF